MAPARSAPDHDWANDPRPALVAEGVARFRTPFDRDEPLAPSLALLREMPDAGPLPEGWRAVPEFRVEGVAPCHERVVRLRLDEGTSVYGCGEAAGALERSGRRIVCDNTDSFDYTDATPSLYQSHPWVLAVRADGTSVGLWVDTTCRVEIDLRSLDWMAGGRGGPPSIEFRVPHAGTPPLAVYCIERDHPEAVLRALAQLTGTIPMPPRWALGYHQCRWSYEPADRVRELAAEFRRRKMPCDVIWLDIDYMDGFRCFTFDPQKFPDPRGLNDDLHAMGFRTVWMIDPGLKKDPEYFAYRQMIDGGHALENIYGEAYTGSVWPGECGFPDFTAAPARAWWAGLYRDYMAQGIDGVWNDMNEPAVFDNPQKQMPHDNWHRADPELGGPGPHSRYRNVYGMLMVRASREGIAAANPDKRPFVLTRSNFLGGQRYAATWTGDNRSDWNSLRWSIPMALNLTLSGQPFAGPDIGGFVGNASPELFARWMGIGALLPFARGHSIKDSVDHEPWSFGEACEHTCRRALQRRSRLMPYLYTLFWRAARDGSPVIRPPFFLDPADQALRRCDDAFLLGGDVLVRARVSPEGTCHTPRPRDRWRVWDPTPLDDGASDPELPELSWRVGSIVPMGPAMEHDGQAPLDPLTLVVVPDATGQAQGELYEDAGDGHEHARGEHRLTQWSARSEGGRLVVSAKQIAGAWGSPNRDVEVIVLVDASPVRSGHGREDTPIEITL